MRYQTITRLAKQKTNYKILMSGRSTGKSTSMAKYLIERYEKTGAKFVRLVRNITYTVKADSYFDAFTYGGKFYDSTRPKRGDRNITYEFYFDENGRRVTGDLNTYYYNGEPFGEVLVLTQSAKYKSGVYDEDIKTFVFDEYIELSMLNYIDNEYDSFMSILSSVCRNRSDVEVWLLGNNLNEDSKYNPYHMRFGIDIDRDNLKPGDLKIYKSGNFKNPAKIAFEFGLMAYENEDEIPLLQRVSGNDVATTGDYAKQFDIFNQALEYPNGLDFLRDSCNNFYMQTDNGKYYYFVINRKLQCFDIVNTDIDISKIGKGGDTQKYNKMIKYRDILKKQYGEDNYDKELLKIMPFDITNPIYLNHNIYGQNLTLFVNAAHEKYPGYSVRYCDGNVKYLWIVTLKNRTLL
jgi:hypothetical protein